MTARTYPSSQARTAAFSYDLHNAVAQAVLGDEGMIGDNSVDLILTDPPYIISKDSGFTKKDADGKGGGDKRFQVYQTDFGNWDRDEFTMADLEHIVRSFFRIMRPGAVAVIFFDLWKCSDLADMLQSAGFANIRIIEWLKTNAVPINSRANYLSNAREIAVVASKPGAPPTFNAESHTGIFREPIYHAKDRFHPTQKSLNLFEQLIALHSNEGDVVLDCFSGSATTGVAAINTRRHYIGCEPDAEYFRKSSERLAQALRASADAEAVA